MSWAKKLCANAVMLDSKAAASNSWRVMTLSLETGFETV